jgi:hypothetical protein
VNYTRNIIVAQQNQEGLTKKTKGNKAAYRPSVTGCINSLTNRKQLYNMEINNNKSKKCRSAHFDKGIIDGPERAVNEIMRAE